MEDGGLGIVMLGFGAAAMVWWASWVVQLCYIGFRALVSPRSMRD